METPWKISNAARRLREGHRVNKITVRDFLRHFGAERRGATKVLAIREILEELGLETDPDFETAWIDAPIWIRLKESGLARQKTNDGNAPDEQMSSAGEVILEGTPSSVEAAEEQAELAPTSDEPETPAGERANDAILSDDPIFRIGSLPAANKKLVVVNQDDRLSRAITLMMEHDFSQLPVMQGEREVKGVVTWKSIARRVTLGRSCEFVRDCREDTRIVDSTRTLFGEIPTIVEHGYVLVRNPSDRKITGIVTASDLSLQFQVLAQPFLLLREIELHIRQMLAAKLPMNDLELLPLLSPTTRKPQTVADLSFGEYIRLVQHPDIWAKLGLKIDSRVFIELLDHVRKIRNDVMHFDQDPMTIDELDTLNRAVRFMRDIADLSR